MNGFRTWGMLAGISGAAAVMIASWASHGLPAIIPPEALELARTRAHSATQQHLVHTLALLGVALWCRIQPSAWLDLAGLLFSIGIVLFSLGIYALYLWWPGLGAGGLRYLVPVGGVAFILGWLALVAAALSSPRRRL